ncbi:hypothetical protein NW754_004123 [Fusarium falciforme]|nr:hypothetical protein NW754_004123 [Fusarium falciforme]
MVILLLASSLVVSLPVSVSVSSLPLLSCTCLRFAPARFVVLSSLVTNSASPSVCCSPPASSTELRTSTTPTPTAFPSPSSSPGLSSSVVVSCSSPDSPRYFVKRGRIEDAIDALSRVRGQPKDSKYVQTELAEIIANEEYERQIIPSTSWIGSWANCFRGSLWDGKSNLRRTILGTSLQMMQQWTGVNFIFYYSTPFLQSTGAIDNSFLISLIFTLVNVFSTPLSFWTVERFGRRSILIIGAFGMLVCQFLVAIIGVTIGFNHTHPTPTEDDPDKVTADNISAVNAQIAFIAIFIFFFASTWGPGAWIVIGEIFPLPIRSRGVGLSTASNWLWNTIIAVITPYMVGENRGNLKSSVFFIWGGLCTCAFVYSYFLVPETKGLSLEQVDKMMEETTPRNSAKWKPHTTFAETMGAGEILEKKAVAKAEHDDSAV